MRLFTLFLSSSIYSANYLIRRSVNKLVDFTPSRRFCNAAEDFCLKNDDKSIVLILDNKRNYKMQYYFLNITGESLNTIISKTKHTLYIRTYISEVVYAMSHLRLQRNNENSQEEILRLEKGMLYIIYQSNIDKVISDLAFELVESQSTKKNEYKLLMKMVLKDKDQSKKVFLIKFRLLHYVCVAIKDHLENVKRNQPTENDFESILLEKYENIQKNIIIILDLLIEKKDALGDVPINLIEFLNAIYGDIIFEREDTHFHDILKFIDFKNEKVSILNGLRVVFEDDKVQLKEGFVTHVLVCVSRMLIKWDLS